MNSQRLHPLLKWTLYGWLLALFMAGVIFLSGHFLPEHGILLGIIIAYIGRKLILKGREETAFRKLTCSIMDRPVSTEQAWKNDWPFCLYLLGCFLSLRYIPHTFAAATVFAAVPFSRMVACQLVLMLPYRGKAEVAPSRYSTAEGLLLFIAGMAPFAPLLWLATGTALNWSWLVFAPCIVMYGLYMLLARHLHGFTYDSMVVVSMIVELAFIATVSLNL